MKFIVLTVKFLMIINHGNGKGLITIPECCETELKGEKMGNVT